MNGCSCLRIIESSAQSSHVKVLLDLQPLLVQFQNLRLEKEAWLQNGHFLFLSNYRMIIYTLLYVSDDPSLNCLNCLTHFASSF